MRLKIFAAVAVMFLAGPTDGRDVITFEGFGTGDARFFTLSIPEIPSTVCAPPAALVEPASPIESPCCTTPMTVTRRSRPCSSTACVPAAMPSSASIMALGASLVGIGLLWFALPRTQNSAAGIPHPCSGSCWSG